MKKLALLLVFVLVNSPVHAETIPPAMLDKEYEACMQGSNEGLPEEKQAYCLCARNKMASWDLDTYARTGQEASAKGGTPAMIEDIAKSCIAETLK